MKTKAILITLALCLFSVAAFAVSPQMGTWNLNEAKSKFPAGAPKNTKVVYEAAGNDIKVTVDGVDGAGAAAHNEWTGRFNGKCYAVTGDPTADQRCYKMVNAHKLLLTNKKDGKITVTGTIVVSANGKTRTLTTNGTDANGKRIRSVAVYDKE